jgi:hypothetical protein
LPDFKAYARKFEILRISRLAQGSPWPWVGFAFGVGKRRLWQCWIHVLEIESPNASTPFTFHIAIIFMAPKISDAIAHEFSPAQDNHAATFWAMGNRWGILIGSNSLSVFEVCFLHYLKFPPIISIQQLFKG